MLKKASRLRVSIGVTSYNEERNIANILQSLLKQKLKSGVISEIMVISSGSTDGTNKIVRRLKRKNPKIRLILQKKRFGKASAVNVLLSNSIEDIIILSSADLLIPPNTLERIIRPLFNNNIGIVGSHPIPINDPKTFFGYAAHLMWKLHHQISLNSPKMGEFIAFRKIFKQIPNTSSVDEASIEALIRGQGYKAVYAPSAIIYNKGAESINEFISRRRHIFAGHLETKNHYSYKVSTISVSKILIALIKNFNLSKQFIFWTPFVIILEAFSRFLGFIDYKLYPKKHVVWKVTPSTKRLSKISL